LENAKLDDLCCRLFFELSSKLFGTHSYLTKDFVDIGKVAYYGDTRRMKQELLSELKYPTMKEGAEIF